MTKDHPRYHHPRDRDHYLPGYMLQDRDAPVHTLVRSALPYTGTCTVHEHDCPKAEGVTLIPTEDIGLEYVEIRGERVRQKVCTACLRRGRLWEWVDAK